MEFDLYAMVQPRDEQDLSTLLDEVLAELVRINAHLEAILAKEDH